jgi:hypothetical protein
MAMKKSANQDDGLIVVAMLIATFALLALGMSMAG